MRPFHPVRLFLLAAAALLPAARQARAADFNLGGQPLRLDLTESMYMSAHLDDGNQDPTTKNYGELLNRLNAQLAWKRFLFSVRFDTGAWVHTPQTGDHSPYVSPDGKINCPQAMPGDPTYLGCVVQPPIVKPGEYEFRLYQPAPDGGVVPNRFRPAGDTVYRGPVPLGIGAFYLEKIALSYSGRSLEATLGDFYVNIGRGLVLSIRKFDELGVDTTLTGAKLIVHEKGFGVIAVAGWSNAQNLDQAQARYIYESNDFISALHVDYRAWNKVLFGAHAMFGRPGCPDGRDCSKDGDPGYVLRPGVMLDAPRLLPWLGVYAEYARQQDRSPAPPPDMGSAQNGNGDSQGKVLSGNAFYGVVNLYAGRTAMLFEFKDYDHYLPWHASHDPFGNMVYQVPPTAERIITQINNNTDIVAGRARFDVRVNRSLLLYWSAQLARSHPSPQQTDTLVDLYAGAQLFWNEGRSHLFPLAGYRNEHQDELHPETPDSAAIFPEVEERLYAFEWDAAQVLPHHLSLEFSGLVWLRRKALIGGGEDAWREGNVYLALRWHPKLVLSAGYEFTTSSQEQNNKHNFFNGQMMWNITSSSSIALFVGGNRPGLKCISGVCRTFPAFEGARLEVVVRL